MALTKKHNHDYSAGIPEATGDRYYAQDLGRDFNYLLDQIGLSLQDQLTLTKGIISGWFPNTSGASTDCVNIPAGIGYAPFDVTVPSTPFTIPPSTATETMSLIRVFSSLVNNFSLITSGATGNGSTTNYLKIKFAYSNNDQRTRAKKSGTYYYNQTPSYTLTCNATPPTSKEICLADIVWNSSTHSITITYTDRSAPAYAGGGSVVLTPSGGDDSIVIQNTVNWLNAIGGGSIILQRGTYLLSTQINWKSNVGLIGQGSSTILKRNSSTPTNMIYIDNAITDFYFNNFTADANEASYGEINAYFYCVNNTSNTNSLYIKIKSVNNKSGGAGGVGSGFYNCVNIENCYVQNVAGIVTAASCYYGCKIISNCYAVTTNSNGYNNYGFNGCYYLDNCTHSGTNSYINTNAGFQNCHYLNNCYSNIASTYGSCYGFNSSTYLSNCNSVMSIASDYSGLAVGYGSCDYLNNCETNSSCSVGTINKPSSRGFDSCTNLSCCNSISSTSINSALSEAIGYNACIGLYSCIGAATATGSSTASGFKSSKHLSCCTGTGTGGTSPIGFKTCYADKATAVALSAGGGGATAADVAAYGWNTGTAAA